MKYTYTTTSTDGEVVSDQGIETPKISLLTLDNIQLEKAKLEIQEQLLIKNGLESNDAETLMKASNFLQGIVEREQGNKKSLLVNPYRWDDAEGYKRKRLRLNNATLRQMSKTPIVRAIISTRQAQVSAFSSPQSNRYDTGFVIRRKKQFYSDEQPEITSSDKKEIQRITDFILNGGTIDNKWHADSFDSFLKKLVADSLEIDQACFEVVEDRKGEPVEYLAVDSGTIYIADSFDDDRKDRDFSDKEKIKGYLPSYVQVIEEQIVAEYYPWQLCFGVRNESTDINMNGYGNSEIEQLIKIITWMLYSDTYNGKFFSQGSSPKGIIKVAPGANRNRLAEFRQSWQSMVAGVENAWKIPVMESDTMDWIDLQAKNTDMQFAQWQEYLIKVACAIFKIAPEEVGFNLGNAGSGGSLFGSDSETKLEYSRDKGLKPLLKSIETWINKYLVSRLSDDFEFIFVGIDSDSEEKEVDLLNKKVQHGMGFKEWRKAMDLPEDLAEGDFPLNAQYIQRISAQEQSAMFGGQSQDNTDAAEGNVWDTLDFEEQDQTQEEFIKGSMSNILGHEQNPMMMDALAMISGK